MSELLEREVLGLDSALPIIFSGIGTSLHAARVAADWVTRLTFGRARVLAVDAHDLGTDYPISEVDQVVVISHRGYKRFPNAALSRASKCGARTIGIVGRIAPEQDAVETIRTCANETAGTFSVSYLASLTILAKLVASIDPDPNSQFGNALSNLPDAISATLNFPLSKALIAKLASLEPLLIVGFGADFVTAQEAALKLKEGAWIWTEAMSPEFALHGTPASFTARMGAVIVAPISDDGGRMSELACVLETIGFPVVASCGEEMSAEFRFTAPHPLLRPFTAILPFHRLTAELARIRKTDPDTLHGHREPWKSIMTSLKL